MKCSRCGEECRDNQAFCLKCGTPIQVVPDFNLIEAELASNVGKLMDEIDKDKEKKVKSKYDELDYLDDEHYATKENIPKKDIEAEMSLSDLEMGKTKKVTYVSKQNNVFQVDSSQYNKQKTVENNTKQNGKQPKKTSNKDAKEKKIFKIKVAILCVVAAIIIGIAVVLLTNVGGSKQDNTFSDNYSKGESYYAAKDYSKAIDSFEIAKDAADDKNEKIKVYKSLINSYEQVEGTDDKQIEVLEEIIKLEPKEYDYFEKLVKLYDKNQMTEEIEKLINSITDVSLLTRLSDYSVSSPVFNMEEGTYDSYITLKLTSSNNYTIYYTIDGSEPDLSSLEYTEPGIELKSEGTYTVKAFAVNDKGISSKVISKNYEIKPTTIDAPVLSPASGQYTADTLITINVPNGMTCYYIYGDTSVTPTPADTKYTEPIPMQRGKKILSAILISETGIISDVTQNIYQLDIARTVQYSDALQTLQNYIVQNNMAVISPEGAYVMANGNTLEFSYNSIALIGNSEYYIINSDEKNAAATVNTTYYGVDTVTGELKGMIPDTENAGKYKITE